MNNLAYNPADDEEAEYWLIDSHRRPGESWDECEARLREAQDDDSDDDECGQFYDGM